MRVEALGSQNEFRDARRIAIEAFSAFPSHPKPSTSRKQDLPKFCRRQWRAHSPSKDGRLPTPYGAPPAAVEDH